VICRVRLATAQDLSFVFQAIGAECLAAIEYGQYWLAEDAAWGGLGLRVVVIHATSSCSGCEGFVFGLLHRGEAGRFLPRLRALACHLLDTPEFAHVQSWSAEIAETNPRAARLERLYRRFGLKRSFVRLTANKKILKEAFRCPC